MSGWTLFRPKFRLGLWPERDQNSEATNILCGLWWICLCQGLQFVIFRERGKQEQRAKVCWSWFDSWLVNCQTKGLLECKNPSWCGWWKPRAKPSTLWKLFSDGLWIWFAGEVWCSHQTSKAFQVQNLMGLSCCQRNCALSAKEKLVCIDPLWESIIQKHSGATSDLVSSPYGEWLISKELPPKGRLCKVDDFVPQLCNAICPRKDDGLAMGWFAAQYDPKNRWSNHQV